MDIQILLCVDSVIDETINRITLKPRSNRFLHVIFVGQLISPIVKSPRFALLTGENVIKNYCKHIAQVTHIIGWTTAGPDLSFAILNSTEQILRELQICR